MPDFRDATADDLQQIVRPLGRDPPSAGRERFEERLPRPYRGTFAQILTSPTDRIILAIEADAVIGSHVGMKLAP